MIMKRIIFALTTALMLCTLAQESYEIDVIYWK